jgi:hypothetical protein
MPSVNLKRFSRSTAPIIEESNDNQDFEVNDNNNDDVVNDDEVNDDAADLFDDLSNVNYVFEEEKIKETKLEKEQVLLQKERVKLEKEMLKYNKENDKVVVKKGRAKAKVEEDFEIDEPPTELLGLDKRQLLKKISEYKSLFPQQLKSFKVKKNPTIDDLQKVIAEMDAIVSVDSVEGFATDAILGCVGLIESVSTKTRYNICGTAELLRNQPKFLQLCKQLYLKHKVFSNVTPEMQLVLVVGMTAMMAKQQNDKRDKYNELLNKPMK